MRKALRHTTAFFALLSAAALVAQPARAQCAARQSHVIVNRKSVRAAATIDLLQLLRRDGGLSRLGILSSSADSQPVVLVDGVLVADGIRHLGDLTSSAVDSVAVLRPTEAVNRFGGVASRGAIVVRTKRGRPAGVADPCPPGRG